jgi:FkbM family methyltransferase
MNARVTASARNTSEAGDNSSDESSGFRRFSELFRHFVERCRSTGLGAAASWATRRLADQLGFPERAIWHVHPHPAIHPLEVRLRGSSDESAFDQIFISRQYAPLRDLTQARLVLDLGAYAGFSSAYFLSAFPNALVVAVEPDERNLSMCKTNLEPYGDRAIVVHGAAWSKSCNLGVLQARYRDGREWSTQVSELDDALESSASVRGWDVASLIELANGETVDLLKVDIERAELSVFDSSSRVWLPRIRNICIELHDKGCEDAFFSAIRDFDYELETCGELTICKNLRERVPA